MAYRGLIHAKNRTKQILVSVYLQVFGKADVAGVVGFWYGICGRK